MVNGASRDLFTAVASAGGALTGLLFVAMSVAPQRAAPSGPPVIRQVRVSAALLSFTNALAVSLFGLVPGTNAGYPAVALGVIGILFTAAAIRSLRSSHPAARLWPRQLELMGLLFVIFGFEFGGGIALIAEPGSSQALEIVGYVLVTSLIVGIARAWELVGDRDTGISASLAVLVGRTPRGLGPDGVAPASQRPAEDGQTGNTASGEDG